MVRRLREACGLPIAVGFGIATPEQARGVGAHADAVIVGSSLVRRIDEAHHGGRDGPTAAREFVASIATGLSVERAGG
jgi:tryptophan synthase alpha chain